MKTFAACQDGLGTSFMVEMNIKQALADLGADVDDFEVSHTDVGSIPDDTADCFFIEHSLEDTLTSIPDERLAPLRSIIDSDEVREKVKQILSRE